MIKQCYVQGNSETNEVYMTSGFQPPTNAPLHQRINASSYMQGYASGGCYSADTQVLTTDGWKYFFDLCGDEEFYTLNLENNGIEISKATKYFEYDYDGPMIRIFSKTMDLFVTPNHKMIYKYAKQKKWEFIEAKEFLQKSINQLGLSKLPKLANWDCEDGVENIDINGLIFNIYDFLEFLGYYISDGYVRSEESFNKLYEKTGQVSYRIILSAKKERKVLTYRNILKKLNITFSEQMREDGCINFTIGSNKPLWSYLMLLGKACDKFIPKEIKMLSKDKLMVLYNSLLFGDGCRSKKDMYYTCSKKLADDVQEIALKIGRNALIRVREREYNIDSRSGISKAYEICIKNPNTRKTFRPSNAVSEYYKGKVYCVEVPNHTLYVKRMSSPVWCGNSVEHVVVDSKLDLSVKKKLIDRILNTHVNYLTMSPVVSVCQKCRHKHIGEKNTCSQCGSTDIAVYARVIGYVRPIVAGNVKTDDGKITGDKNFWQNSRRVDWVERSKESSETHSYQ